jgi:hypothetical protein
MNVRHATGDGGPHLSNLVNRHGVLRDLHFSEDPHDTTGLLSAQVPHLEGELGLRDGPYGADVVGFDSHDTVG